MIKNLAVGLSRGVLLAFTLALCQQFVRAQQARAPQAENQAPQVDGTMFSLLDNSDVLAAVKLDGGQKRLIENLKQAYVAEAKRFTERIRNAGKAEERNSLAKEMANSSLQTLLQVGEALTQEQVGRLFQLKLHALGTRAIFLADLRKLLDVTKEQDAEYQKAVQLSNEAVFVAFRQEPLEVNEADSLARLQRLRHVQQTILDKLVLEIILTGRQREQFEHVKGMPPAFKLALYQPQQDFQEFKARLNRRPGKSVIVLEAPYSLPELIQVSRVNELLAVSSEEATQLLECARGWQRARDPFYQGLGEIDRRQLDSKVAAARPQLQELLTSAEHRILSILGEERFRRLVQVQLQIRGPGALLGVAFKKEFAITDEQWKRIATTAHENTNALSKELGALSGKATPQQLSDLGMRFRCKFDGLVLAALTSDQQGRWQERIGAPLDETTKQAIIEAVDALQLKRPSGGTP